MKYTSAQPHIASYVLLQRADGKIALLLRTGTAWANGFYSLPAGKVEDKESYTHAAIREAREEVGVTIKLSDLEPVFTLQRLHTKEATGGNPYWVDLFFKVTKWQGEANNAEPHKHGELIWADPNNLPPNTLPYVKIALQKIHDGKTYAEYGWSNNG